jgi:hypothetical protein
MCTGVTVISMVHTYTPYIMCTGVTVIWMVHTYTPYIMYWPINCLFWVYFELIFVVSIRRWSLLTFSFCVSFVAICGCSHSSVCMFYFVSRWQELILGACVEEDKLVCAVRGPRAAASEHFHFGTRTDPMYETLYPFWNNRRRAMSWSCVTTHKCFYPHHTF